MLGSECRLEARDFEFSFFHIFNICLVEVLFVGSGLSLAPSAPLQCLSCVVSLPPLWCVVGARHWA